MDGSPYEWSIEVTQYDSGVGSPEDPNMRVLAERRSHSGTRPYQAHIWEFDLAAGALEFNQELRQVALDTGLLPAYGAIFMDLQDLSPVASSKSRCPKNGDLLSNTRRRTGVLRGSMTFLTGYGVDPQMPDEVGVSHVPGSITRTRYTGNDCPYNDRCLTQKLITASESAPGGGNLVNAGSSDRDAFLFQQVETVGIARIVHFIVGVGNVDVVSTTPTGVTVVGDVAAPFVDPGGMLSWTKGANVVEERPRCETTTWTLTNPTGSMDLNLDSGDQTIGAPSTAQFVVERHR